MASRPDVALVIDMIIALVANVADITLRWRDPNRAGVPRSLPSSSALASERFLV